MTLANLPSPILAIIFHGKVSHLVINLWKCGNKQINQRLENGIEYMDLKDCRLDTTSRYPKMLSSLRQLRYLSLDRGEWPLMATPADVSAEIQRISPSKLETLKLICKDVASCLWQYDENKSPIYTDHEHGKSAMLPLSAIFPHLVHLLVGDSTSKDLLSSADLPRLPPTLRRLSGPLNCQNQPTLSLLPRSLEEWDINLSSGDFSTETFWSDPPPYLTTIKRVSIPFMLPLPKTLVNCRLQIGGTPPSISVLNQLPPSLVDITSFCTVDSLNVFNEYMKMSLHPGLTRLELNLTSAWWPQVVHTIPKLPSTLTSLEFSSTISYGVSSLDWSLLTEAVDQMTAAKFWPSGLLSLGSKLPWSNDDAYLPPWLEKVSLFWPNNMEGDCLKTHLLPRSLKSLNIELFRPPEAQVFSEYLTFMNLAPGFPPNLTELDIGGIWYTHTTLASLRHLPSSLTSLRFKECYVILADEKGKAPAAASAGDPGALASVDGPATDAIDASSIVNDDTAVSPAFPPHIKELELLQFNLAFLRHPNLLPPTLTKLYLSRADFASKHDVLDDLMHLPTSLTYLFMDTVEYRSDTDNKSFPVFDTMNFVARLPHLKQLRLAHFAAFHPYCLAALPKSLAICQLELTHFEDRYGPYINPHWQRHSYIILQGTGYEFLAKYWSVQVPPHGWSAAAKGTLRLRRVSALNDSTQYPHPRVKAQFPSNVDLEK